MANKQQRLPTTNVVSFAARRAAKKPRRRVHCLTVLVDERDAPPSSPSVDQPTAGSDPACGTRDIDGGSDDADHSA